jgi:phosphonatase-like hydrolase
MISLVVFDMAGTTVLDKGHVAGAFLDAFRSQGLALPEGAADPVMGYRKVDAIRILLRKYFPEKQDNLEESISAIHSLFEQKMVDFYLTDPSVTPMPGAEVLFNALRDLGVKVALNTGFTRKIADAILYRIGWRDSGVVDATICSDEVPEGRPAPFMMQRLMELTGVADSRTVAKVGDTEVDIEEGQEALCGLVIAVTTGSCTREELLLQHPDAVVDSLEEAGAILLNRI